MVGVFMYFLNALSLCLFSPFFCLFTASPTGSKGLNQPTLDWHKFIGFALFSIFIHKLLYLFIVDRKSYRQGPSV
jgi:hypothetical protein